MNAGKQSQEQNKRFQAAAFVDAEDEMRLTLLNRQLNYAREHSAFYRETLGTFGALKCLDDVSSLPFTDSEDIRAHGEKMVCVSAGEVQRIVSLQSSGTSGRPKRLYFTAGDLARTVDFFAEGMSWMCGRGEEVGIFMPCASPDGIGDLLSRGLCAIGALPLPCGLVTDAAQAAQQLSGRRPEVLVGLPWQMRLLALTMPELRPRTVLLSGDYVPCAMYGFLREQWGCDVLAHFGMTETGYGCAVESPGHDGQYLRRNELLAQSVDPKTGKILPPGQPGELVLTTLRREAMPLIRYRTGDWVILNARGDIERVLGRIDEGRVGPIIADLDEVLCPLKWLADYTAVWHGETRALSIEVETLPDAPADGEGVLTKLASAALRDPTYALTVHLFTPSVPHPMQGNKRIVAGK